MKISEIRQMVRAIIKEEKEKGADKPKVSNSATTLKAEVASLKDEIASFDGNSLDKLKSLLLKFEKLKKKDGAAAEKLRSALWKKVKNKENLPKSLKDRCTKCLSENYGIDDESSEMDYAINTGKRNRNSGRSWMADALAHGYSKEEIEAMSPSEIIELMHHLEGSNDDNESEWYA